MPMNEKSSLRGDGGANIKFWYMPPTSTSDDENVLYSATDVSTNSGYLRAAAPNGEINANAADRSPIDKIQTTASSKEGEPFEEKLPISLDDLMSRRDIQNPTSNMDVMMHILKCNVGTGVLAMPDAIKNAGLTLGTLGLIFISIVAIHCMHLAVKCSHRLCLRTSSTSLNYATTVQYSFATGPSAVRRFSALARFLTNFFLCLTQLGFCCVYLVFVSNNIKDIVDRNTSAGSRLNYRMYGAIILVPIILTNMLRNLKFLSPLSTIANVLQVISLSIIFYYICRDVPSVESRQQVAHFSTLPLWFGTIIFSFEGIGLVLPLENSMKTPKDFGGLTGVLNTSMMIVSCLYVAVGFFGYAKYGDEVFGSITLNLPNGVLADVVRGGYALAIFLTYAVQFYVPIQVMWPVINYHVPANFQYLGEIVFRIIIILITFALACLIPQLSLFISLVGAFSGSYLAIILPPILEVVTFWNDGISRPVIVKDVAIFLIGMLGCLTGTYVSIAKIIETFDKYN